MGVLCRIGRHARETGSDEGVHHLDSCVFVGEVVVGVCCDGERSRLGMERRSLLVYGIVVAVKADRGL